jgi:O-antigen/teichoic acid export membrane protein
MEERKEIINSRQSGSRLLRILGAGAVCAFMLSLGGLCYGMAVKSDKIMRYSVGGMVTSALTSLLIPYQGDAVRKESYNKLGGVGEEGIRA